MVPKTTKKLTTPASINVNKSDKRKSEDKTENIFDNGSVISTTSKKARTLKKNKNSDKNSNLESKTVLNSSDISNANGLKKKKRKQSTISDVSTSQISAKTKTSKNFKDISNSHIQTNKHKDSDTFTQNGKLYNKKKNNKISKTQDKMFVKGKRNLKRPMSSAKVNQQIISNRLNIIETENNLNKEDSVDFILEHSHQKSLNQSKSIVTDDDDDSTSEDDWEEVPEKQNLDDYTPELPEGGVDITIENPNLNYRRKKNQFDVMGYIRCQINRAKKEIQLKLHQVHLLCLLAHGFYLNNILNSDDIKGYSLSLLPSDFCNIIQKNSKLEVGIIEDFVDWFRGTFKILGKNKLHARSIKKNLFSAFERKVASNSSEYNLLFIGLARTLGMEARLCMSFYPITFKPSGLLKKKKDESDSESVKQIETELKQNSGKEKKSKLNTNKNLKSSETKSLNSTDDKIRKKIIMKSIPNRTKKTSYKASNFESDDDTKDKDFKPIKVDSDSNDSDFTPVKKKRSQGIAASNNKKMKTPLSKKNRKILSSDSESSIIDEPTKGIECWVEIYSRAKEKWICVECSKKIIDKPYTLESYVTQPISYVLAFDNKSYAKDVTKRYCSQWMTHTRKLRKDPEWWEDTLEPFLPPNSKFDKNENSLLQIAIINKPLPAKISEFKNHPLYALKRHLLKFEGIYPPDAKTIGFVRGEAVYARENIHTLHSRETWVKEARLVRIGEEPYKIVKARPKWDKIAGVLRTDLPLELFGRWQTEDYMPPIAYNGKVPRNEYGNVELFKPCMLPIGTVHLRIPCLNRIAKKLGIDCSPAVVGFDGHRGSVHPVFDGFIVCEEFKDTLLLACEEEQENARKREEEKRLKRIYGNWKKLVKSFLIREKIKRKYGPKDDTNN